MTIPKKVAFDINNTLTHSLIKEVFIAFQQAGWETIVWSTLGVDYAQEFCEAHDLHPTRIITKHSETVDIAIDDIPSSVTTAKLVLGVTGTTS